MFDKSIQQKLTIDYGYIKPGDMVDFSSSEEESMTDSSYYDSDDSDSDYDSEDEE